MTKPISPSQVGAAKASVFPSEVVDVFNHLITTYCVNGSSTFKQVDAIDLIRARLRVSRAKIMSNGWLNIEDLYRSVGWQVTYDKPGYNESYPATFTFSKP